MVYSAGGLDATLLGTRGIGAAILAMLAAQLPLTIALGWMRTGWWAEPLIQP